ncbi:MAG: DUF1501 domain-containing protein [Gemmataceae bacterium]|nr:DUF1501 domain-containing protein [Gemmataceae bacterium]
MLPLIREKRTSRRGFLGLGIPGLAAWANALGASPSGKGRAKSVLVVFCGGGQSQLEMWDPKPNAPEEIRGAFSSILTRTPGVRFGEHLPMVAAQSHRFSVLRSVTHDDLDHGSACYLSLTGHFHPRKSSNPPPRPDDPPTLASLYRRIRPGGPFGFSSTHINGPLFVPDEPGPGQNGGTLGRVFDPLQVDPVNPELSLPALTFNQDLPFLRFQSRRQLLHTLDKPRQLWDSRAAVRDFNGQTEQAFELLGKPGVRDAFDLSKEPVKVRERYGKHRNGQACLLARRLVEREMPWVTVFWNPNIRGQDNFPDETDEYGWDTHNDIFEAMKVHLLPRFDQSFSALLEDLDERGLLATTLVLCLGEFGRAPLVALEPRFKGATPGRKHWAQAYSVVFAGAGVKRGAVVGATDRRAGSPVEYPVTPPDLAATLFDSLGIAPDAHFYDLLNKPQALTTGKVIHGLFS